MTQIERISRMERILEEAAEAAKAASQSPEQCLKLMDDVAELEAYYTGPQWKRDYEDDCEGRLPKTLRRGVLSEDAIYDLLQEWDEIRKRFKAESTM